MNTKTVLSEQIERYLLEHPIDRSFQYPYREAAEYFGVEQEHVRSAWRKLRRKGLVEKENSQQGTDEVVSISSTEVDSNKYESVISVNGDKSQISTTTPEEVRTLEDLIRVCKIDTKQWEVVSWICRKWDVRGSTKDVDIKTKALFSVSASLKKKVVEKDFQLQRAAVIDEIKEYLSRDEFPRFKNKAYEGGEVLLEICIPDIHLGKLSWEEESGEDYDIKIAVNRYKMAVADLVSKVPIDMVDRILLPIGNDMITMDSRRNMTTAGTPQDSDSRFRKLLLVAKEMLVDVITSLSQIAPVDVLVVSGNHDYDSMFTLGMVLEAFYHNDPNVFIDNSPTQRKYYQYHNTGIMFTHGNEEKHQDLGLIFATEKSQLWAATQFREVQLGHLHKNKKLNYVSVDEYQGFQVQIIPSLSGTDFWHNSKGYNSLKQAKAFLYDKSEGKIGEFTYTIRKQQ